MKVVAADAENKRQEGQLLSDDAQTDARRASSDRHRGHGTGHGTGDAHANMAPTK